MKRCIAIFALIPLACSAQLQEPLNLNPPMPIITGANIPCASWQTFEFAAAADGITAGLLSGTTYGAALSWMMRDASGETLRVIERGENPVSICIAGVP